MKLIRLILLAFFAIAITPAFAQQSQSLTTDTIKVNGECGMCNSRIQKALKMDGISASAWDSKTKLLVVTYNSGIITNDDIQKKMAEVGHDTDKYRAEDSVYDKLPGCCHYKREVAKK